MEPAELLLLINIAAAVVAGAVRFGAGPTGANWLRKHVKYFGQNHRNINRAAHIPRYTRLKQGNRHAQEHDQHHHTAKS